MMRAVPALLLSAVAATAVAGVAAADPGLPSVPGIPGPTHKLQILPGRNSTGANGTVADGKADAYSIDVPAGRHLAFNISSPGNDARVSVAPLVGPMVATNAPGANTVSNGLDYQIQVSSADGQPANYNLTVSSN
jgi:hypothetical protein